MEFYNALKWQCIVAYVGFIIVVPPNPSIYTFSINCLGYCVNLAASVFVIYFLNTRPLIQKNVLNRLLVLILLALILGSTRHFFVSFLSCFLSSNIYYLLETYPGIVHLLSYRYYVLLEICLASCLSVGRLLLFTNPVVFHRLQPSHGARISCIISLSICATDFIYGWIMCFNGPSSPRIMFNFKIDNGLWERMNSNSTTEEPTNKLHEKEENSFSFHLPTIQVLMLFSLLMELSRIVFVFLKEVKKMKKNPVAPTVSKGNQAVSQGSSYNNPEPCQTASTFLSGALQRSSSQPISLENEVGNNSNGQGVIDNTISVLVEIIRTDIESPQNSLLMPYDDDRQVVINVSPIRTSEANTSHLNGSSKRLSDSRRSCSDLQDLVLSRPSSNNRVTPEIILDPHFRSFNTPTMSQEVEVDILPIQTGVNTNQSFVLKVIKQQCMKSATFITINILAGFIITGLMYTFPSFSNIPLMLVNRFLSYVLVLLLFLVDKDITECLKEKVQIYI